MMLKSFQKVKKAGCILFAVLILWMTPACDYLDVRHMETVDAASIAVGVTAVSLLKVTAAAFGVVIAAAATAKAVDSFQEWLDEHGDAQSIATWNQAQAEAQSVALNASFVGSVRSWLGSRFSSLDSGSVESVMVGTGVITNGVELSTDYAELEAAFLSSQYSAELNKNYFYYFRTMERPCMDLYTSNLTGLYCFFSTNGNFQICQVSDNKVTGSYINTYRLRGCLSNYSFSRLSSGEVSTILNSFPFDGIYPFRTNIPVICTGLPSSVSSGALFSTILSHATATYGLDASEPFATSFGSFSDANLANLAAVNLTAAGIEKIQQAVDQAVAGNTSTGDDGKPVYTPEIAQAVIDAYQQGLADAGAIDPDVPVDPDTPVDPDDPVVPPGDGILDFLGGLKDSLKTWITAIPDAVSAGVSTIKGILETGWTTLWGHLTGIGDTLSGIGEAVGTGFSQVVSGITDIPGTLGGLFEDLHDWILGIPGTFDGLFEGLHDWILDIPQTLTAGFGVISDSFEALRGWLLDLMDAIPTADAITLPITDAVSDVLTVDPDAVREAIDAEAAELWNLPFLDQAQELYSSIQASDTLQYPQIRIETPEILKSCYQEPEIILLDFEDYGDYCQWARLLIRAALWLAFVWHVIVLVTPKLRIS